MATMEQITRLESAKTKALASTETRQNAFKVMRELESLRYTRQEGKLHKAEDAYNEAVQVEMEAWEDYKLASRGE